MNDAHAELTLGPNPFNWAPGQWRDFYFRIADEAPVAAVYLGETICSKRAPLLADVYETVAERLRNAGKTVLEGRLDSDGECEGPWPFAAPPLEHFQQHGARFTVEPATLPC